MLSSLIRVCLPEYEIWLANTVTEANLNFDSQAVPMALTIECTDGTTTLTEGFNVNIVDSVSFLLVQ